MSVDDVARSAPRRTHRVLAVYLVMYAWVKKLDCVIIDGVDLRTYLGDISRLEESRKKNIVEDVEQFFPYSHFLSSKGGESPTLFLSRVEMPTSTWAFSGLLYKYKEHLIANGVRAGFVKLPEEGKIVALSAKVIHGIEEFAPLIDHSAEK